MSLILLEKEIPIWKGVEVKGEGEGDSHPLRIIHLQKGTRLVMRSLLEATIMAMEEGVLMTTMTPHMLITPKAIRIRIQEGQGA